MTTFQASFISKLCCAVLFSVFVHTIDHNNYFVVLSSPGQASTALSYILAVLPSLHCPLCILESCGGVHEALNPRCSSNCPDGFMNNDALERCMGSQGRPLSLNIWKSQCLEEDLQNMVESVTRNRITLIKDVFSPTKLPLFVKKGFQVVVAFKPPWLTFPTSVSGIYDNIHDEYCLLTRNTSNSDDILHPALGTIVWSLSCFPEALTDLTTEVSSGGGRKKRLYFTSIPPPCFTCRAIIAHYIFHFHLILSARKHGVAVVDTSQLFSLPPKLLRRYLKQKLPTSLLNGRTGTKQIDIRRSEIRGRVLDSMVNRTIYFRSSRVIRAHSYRQPQTNNATAIEKEQVDGAVAKKIFLDKSVRFKQSGCGECLRRIVVACTKLLPNCAQFNRIYGAEKYLKENSLSDVDNNI